MNTLTDCEQVTAIPSPFQFLALPIEIQRMVLMETDLIAPFDIQWTVTPPHLRLTQHQRLVPKELHNLTPDKIIPNFDTPGCLCRRMPSNLFLVNRHIQILANEIFFSMNRFVATIPFKAKNRSNAFLEFFISLPKQGLKFIRELEFRFYHTELEELNNDSNEIAWPSVVRLLHTHLDMPRMAISLNSSLDDYIDINRMRVPDGSLYKHIHLLDYKFICTLFARWERPKDFFVYLSEDLCWSDDEECVSECSVDPKTCEGYCRNNLTRIDHEKRLEKIVMGQEYDSDAEGKYYYVPNPHRCFEEDDRLEVCEVHQALGYISAWRGS